MVTIASPSCRKMPTAEADGNMRHDKTASPRLKPNHSTLLRLKPQATCTQSFQGCIATGFLSILIPNSRNKIHICLYAGVLLNLHYDKTIDNGYTIFQPTQNDKKIFR